MPTISRSLVQPLVTPSTALLTSARARPCTAACESFSRIATRLPSFCSILIPDGRDVSSLPFGPWTITVLPSILTVTPFGIAIGFFPIRDISSALSLWLLALGFFLAVASALAKGQKLRANSLFLYQISQSNSPPSPSRRAWRPVITPLGVVRILIPIPPSTRGISVRRTYTRQPGRDTRARFVITASLLLPY